MYDEKDVKTPWLILLGLTLLTYLCSEAYVVELSETESIQANLLFHSSQNGWFDAALNGTNVNRSPLYTWFAALFSSFGASNLSLRLPSIFALFGMGALSFAVSFKYGGKRAAWPALAICLSSIGALQMSLRANELMLSSFFMAAAWTSWFLISRKPKRWFQAWSCGLLFTSLAASLNGPHMYFLFYFPLIFMTRPTDIRKRMTHLPHIIALISTSLIILCLHSLLVTLTQSPSFHFSFFSSDLTPTFIPDFNHGQLYSIIKFPFSALIAFMPWPFVVWTGFCEAFRIIEKNSKTGIDVFRYMRRICLAIFFVYMFYPNSNYYSLMPLIVPLSILGGLHYQIFIRRHFKVVRTVVNIFNGICVIMGSIIASMAVYRLQKSISDYQALRLNNALNYAFAAIALGLIIVIVQRRTNPLWLRGVFVIIIMHSLISATKHLQYHEYKYSAEAFANHFHPLITEDQTVYNFTQQNLYRESFYLNLAVNNVNEALDTEQLPNEVYVLAGKTKPVQFTTDSTYYHWEAISTPITNEDKETVILYRGLRDTL